MVWFFFQEKDAAWKALKDREAILKQLESV
jgi:hypothetical protein